MINILVILLFYCFIRNENKLWEDAEPCNLMIINNRGNRCRKWKAAYPMGEYRLHTQRSSIVRLLTAHACWNLCTNGSFKLRGGDIGYPWGEEPRFQLLHLCFCLVSQILLLALVPLNSFVPFLAVSVQCSFECLWIICRLYPLCLYVIYPQWTS